MKFTHLPSLDQLMVNKEPLQTHHIQQNQQTQSHSDQHTWMHLCNFAESSKVKQGNPFLQNGHLYRQMLYYRHLHV